ncbi:hypothetical protein I6E91_19435 [Enterocloster clostridioformis]|uniref:hypothetical protein n=1 Tax=Enterocloster clostridioformis TaxID=1531 RepID=UPI001F449DF6|nr:hypothetical protein [Enterocloster clostridioformis]MCF2704216.1 hypothetical protein [Enterocloster clostridioformis]
MGFCEIKNPPEFNTDVEKWNTETLADGENMGAVIELLVNNTIYNKTKCEKLSNEVTITLPASGWSTAAPYTQSVAVPGLKATDKVRLMSAAKKDTPAQTVKIWEKMAGMIKAGEAMDGQAVFYCPLKKPTADVTITLIGVSANE